MEVKNTMKSAEILKDLIAFNTISANPNLDLMQYISNLLLEHGINSTLIKDDTGKKANLYASVGRSNLSGVMLSGHTDVVPVDGQDWTKPPFELTQENDKFYGRGTCDMKGFVACAIIAAINASKQTLTTPLHLAFSYDEEIGCVGVRSMIDMLAKSPIRPAMCIVGEPTSLTVATGHKGKVGMIAHCTGKEGHSALAPFALNALHLGCDFINILRDIQTDIEANGIRDTDYDVPYSTIHVGKFNGGIALNVVPNSCEVAFEIRNIAEDDPQMILDKIKQATVNIVRQARKKASEADIQIEIFNTYPGMYTKNDSAVVSFVKSLTGANDTCKVAFGTEGGLFSKELGIPTVVCGPGSMEQGHKPDEYIEIDQLNRCDHMLAKLIEQLKVGV